MYWKRILAMMLVLAMACASIPALSEDEAESAPVELVIEIYQENEPTEEPTAKPTEEPTGEPTAEPTQEPTAEPSAEPSEEPTEEPTAEPTAEPTTEPSKEPALGADQLADFDRGYARVQAGSFLYDGASPAAQKLYYTEGGIVYADDRKAASECDRIRVHFDGGEEALTAWADARDLLPLSEQESADFTAGIQALFFHNDDPTLPLAAIAYSKVINVPSGSGEENKAPAMLVDRESLTLGQKESASLTVWFSDSQAHAITFTSEDKKIATVDASGKVTGRTRGSTCIVISGEFGNEIRVPVTVMKAPGSIKLRASRKTVGVGQKPILTHTLSAGSASAISYSSSNEDVIRMLPSGIPEAIAPGKAVITARTFNGKTAKITITVKAAPTYLRYPAESIIMGVEEVRTLLPEMDEGSMTELGFSSSDPSIVAVNETTGQMQALSTGHAVITAVTHNDLQAELAVEVKNPPKFASLDASSITIGVNEIVDLPILDLGDEGDDCGGGYKLKSGDKKIAAITADGRIQGKKVGKTTITLTTYNGHKAKLTVKVKKAPGRISFDQKELLLGVGEETFLEAVTPAGSAGEIRISSSDETIAAVDAIGNVTAIAPGSCIITAETYNGKSAECAVTVKNAPDRVALKDMVLGVGEKLRPEAILPEDAAGGCDFEIADTSIASLTGDGKIKAKAKGETTLTVTCYNGVSAEASLIVQAAPKKVNLPESKLTLSKGDTYQLGVPTITGEDAACSSFTYKSSEKKIATVSADGLITAKKAGSAVITITTFNGKKDTVKLTVKAAPKKISFAETPGPLLVDDVFTPEILFSNKAKGNYTLSSSDETVARITDDGLGVLALSGGQATITAAAYNGVTAEMVLSVKHLPDSVALSPAEVTLGAGDTVQLNPAFPSGQGSHVSYTSSDANIASAGADGLVRTHAAGSAVITVHTRNGKTAQCRIHVLEAPSRIDLSPRIVRRSLNEGGVQLSYSLGSEAEGGRVEFSSSDESIAAVDRNGYVRFLKAGTVVITAETYNNRRGYSEIEIGETPGSMAFAAENISVALGDTITIPVNFLGGCESYRLSSSDADIAIAEGDQVTALQEGSCTLTAESLSGLQAQCTLTVTAPPTGIDLAEEAIEMKLHVTPAQKLTAHVLPAGAGSVVYTSSNPDVAAVDIVTGEVRATGVGSCIITASTYDGLHSDSCTVTVRHLLEGVKIGIDPGHQRHANMEREAISPKGGGSKPKVSSGTHGVVTGKKEYVVNLQISLLLRDALEKLGAEVHMTRETHDVNISNKQRAKMMNELGVDLVLRLHCNSSDSSSAKGISIYVRKTGTGKTESYQAAKQVLKYMVKETGAKKRGVKKSDSYTGLNWSTVPSMLVEMGFMSNSKEDRNLSKPEYQEKLVRGMINGICEYMGRDLAYPYE